MLHSANIYTPPQRPSRERVTKLVQPELARVQSRPLRNGVADAPVVPVYLALGGSEYQDGVRILLAPFRVTFATWSLWAGVDLRTVQQWLGHSDMESTMRYLKPSRSQQVREKVNEIFR
jgi:hypothetical protein